MIGIDDRHAAIIAAWKKSVYGGGGISDSAMRLLAIMAINAIDSKPEITDTDRLNWLIERMMTSKRRMLILASIGMSETDLTGSGDQDLGQIFRAAIDRYIRWDALKPKLEN